MPSVSLLHRIRRVPQRLGYDVVRFPPGEARRSRVMREKGVTVVLDVGANAGQYAEGLRRGGFEGRIESFEPVTEAFQRLSTAAAGDSRWNVHHIALGDQTETRTLNVAANSAASSSLLPMHHNHLDIAPHAAYVATEDVQVKRLDDLAHELLRPDDRVLLKMDVQGFEGHILDGAAAVLRRVVGVEMEVAFIPLYEGQLHFVDAFRRMDEAGLGLADLLPIQRVTGERIAWCDALFVRP
jgi:FkbM family methyltransferase